MSITLQKEYDVVIVGGGMVGASLACALQSAANYLSLKILIIESLAIKLDENPLQPSFDSRSTVLSFGTVEYFRQLGLWKELKNTAEAIKNIHVSDQGKFGAVRMDSENQGVDALGFVLENKALGHVLNKAMVKADRVEVCSPVQVIDIHPGSESISLVLEKENKDGKHTEIIKTRLAVLAEGGRSGLCEKIGIHRNTQSYRQVAIIANVAFDQPHKNVAYERFTAKGPMALLPLPTIDGKHRAALIWTQAETELDKILALNDLEFLQRLQSDFGSRLGNFTKVGERFSYPLSLQQSEEQSRPGLVLLGNVVHSLHPVAGQGFNLAMRDTMCLAESIIEALEQGKNPGSVKNLQAYCKKTEADQDLTIAFSHYMTQIFSNNNEPLIWARKFGLLSIDLLPPLKKSLSRQAMGMRERRVKF